jgi:hypothetical protein
MIYNIIGLTVILLFSAYIKCYQLKLGIQYYDA